MSHLSVYKASAGSGKTFTLTRHFLFLLFSEKGNYKHILAATFTNKATEEMKNRVISELHNLATGGESAHREYLLTRLGHLKTAAELNALAKATLSDVLHDYSHLSITTIDRFFQRIIRAFAREIHVSSTYNIELDDKEVLQNVSEQLFFNLEKKGNEALVHWLTDFAEEQIENGSTWDFSKSIGALSEEFLSETYKRVRHENGDLLGDFVFLNHFLSKIAKHQLMLRQRMKTLAQKGVAIVKKFELNATDFKYGKSSGINFLFYIAEEKIPEKIGARTLDMLEQQTAFYTKTAPQKDNIIAACNSGLEEVLRLLVQCWRECNPMYQSIDLIRANFYSLGILSDLERQLKAYTDDNNILLLSGSNELIAGIIDGSDAPFIYEKTGCVYKHFMIDEFQDTSRLQWYNLRPLVGNSLSEGKENLLVGDVKQSIYRWRNSDWRQLDHGIKEEFAELATEQVLPTNWRSSEGIIRFNNTVIKAIAAHLKERFITETGGTEDSKAARLFDSAYADIVQAIPPEASKNAYVAFRFFNKENNDDWQENVISRLPQVIEEAQDKGYRLSDIAILVRRNSEGAQISRFLLNYAATHPSSKYKYNVISDEALWISASYDVRFLCHVFEYLVQPDALSVSQLNVSYQNHLDKNKKTEAGAWEMTVLHPDIKEKIKHLTSLSLLETTEEIITRFELGSSPSEAIFVQAFVDIIHDFEQHRPGGINEFLQWWGKSGKTHSVSTPEGQDAINILTVHKSKGLEYKIVIVPFLNWDVDRDKGYLWSCAEEAPLNEIPYLPIRISDSLRYSLFRTEYEEEKLLQYIDSLNLLYVAFTRAKEVLIGFGNSEKKTTLDTMLTQVFAMRTAAGTATLDLSSYWHEDELYFEYGHFPLSEKEKKTHSQSLQLYGYKSNQQNHNLKLRLQSHDFFIVDGGLQATASKAGKIWHRLFEQVEHLEDLPQALENLSHEGLVSFATTQTLLLSIKEAINQPIVRSWFSPEAQVRREPTILTPEGRNYRPDRIVQINDCLMVIDFKFGRIEKNAYQKQVQHYMELMRAMGKTNLVGYLWYVSLGKVVEI